MANCKKLGELSNLIGAVTIDAGLLTKDAEQIPTAGDEMEQDVATEERLETMLDTVVICVFSAGPLVTSLGR